MHRFTAYTVHISSVTNLHHTIFGMPKMGCVFGENSRYDSKGTVYRAYCDAYVTAPEIIPLVFY